MKCEYIDKNVKQCNIDLNKEAKSHIFKHEDKYYCKEHILENSLIGIYDLKN